MEVAVSFVAGIMLGVAVLHLLPHALLGVLDHPREQQLDAIMNCMLWLVGGFLVMFFVERFFCFHHHEVPDKSGDQFSPEVEHQHGPTCEDHPHSDHMHDLTWSGAAVGLTLHSVLAGVALAASVAHGHQTAGVAGLGTFLVIFLHKPFDAMTLGTLMAKSRWSIAARCAVNGLFALAIPVGALLFHVGLATYSGSDSPALSPALSFSAGLFLCIAMSDLLPELQFHHHDRLKLSVALMLGLVVAYVAGLAESAAHRAVNSSTTAAQSPIQKVAIAAVPEG
jgi:zinc and cadmium transporter